MQNKKTYTVEEAKRRLEAYCAYQERCHDDVVKKLRSMHMIPVAVDTVVAHLIEHGFLNEERFARSYARGKFNIKKWGKIRIVRELKHRNISRFNIQLALKEIPDTDYHKTFNELAEKKAGQLTGTNLFKKKQQLANYLLYRGWESDLVYEKINDLLG
ncbi:regulatory protein RecX [Galbibacter sp. PAP.153]|uniref:regulatory protein RecX n=1 Tax=Galbibacter sp. PAP.153 TaxID=3104623 RepID=UPI00300B2A97